MSSIADNILDYTKRNGVNLGSLNAYYSGHVKTVSDLLNEGPVRLEQSRRSSLFSSLFALGSISWINGELAAAREHWRLAVEEKVRIFELRGASSKFPVSEATPDGRLVDVTESGPDYSMTSGKQCIRGVFQAISIGEVELAALLARMAWDPPDASYVGLKSSICRPEDVILAQIGKHWLSGDGQRLDATIEKFRKTRSGERACCVCEGIAGISSGDSEAVLQSLDRVLEFHKGINPDRNQYEANTYMELACCFWATGLAVQAVRSGVLTLADLPADRPYFRSDFIKTSLAT